MRVDALTKIQNLMKQGGGYRCPHFEVHKLNANIQKKSCCGNDRGDQYAPTCSLINGLCTGLAQCPRLDVKTKGKLIKLWMEDLARSRSPNPLEYTKK